MQKKCSIIVVLLLGLLTSLCPPRASTKEPPEIKYSIPDQSQSLQNDYLALFRSFLDANTTVRSSGKNTSTTSLSTSQKDLLATCIKAEACRADVPDLQARLKDALPAAALPETDLLLAGFIGGMQELIGDFASAEDTLTRVFKHPDAAGRLSHTIQSLFQMHLARACFYQGRTRQAAAGEAFRAAQAEIAAAITNGEFSAQNAQIAYRLILAMDSDVLGGIDWPQLWGRIEKNTQIDPWLRNMLQGCTISKDAWGIRGNAFAQSVPEDKMRAFLSGIERAVSHFQSAHDLHRERPEAAVKMIASIRSNSESSPHDAWYWFLQATAAQFDYLEAYRAFAYDLTPRWHGSIEQMENFADACRETKRYDTIIPFLYIRTMRDVANEMKSSGGKSLFRRDDVRDKVREVLDGYEKEPSWTGYDQACLTTQRMLVSSWQGDYSEAKKLLDSLPVRVDLRYGFRSITLIDNGWYWDQIEAEIAAFSGPHASELSAAEMAASAGDTETAVRGFRTVMQTCAGDPAIHGYLRDRTAMIATGIYNFGDLGLLNNMVYWNHIDQVRFLVENGYPVDGRPNESWTPLRYAIHLKKTGIAKLLVEKGADLNPTLVLDTSYFDLAASSEQWDLALELLRKGAPFDPKTCSRHLIGAIDKQQSELASLMIDRGADVNYDGPDGWKPILYAINGKQHDLAMKLLDKGAKVDAVTKDGWNVLLMSILNDEAVALRVIDQGADVNFKMKDGMMPLHLAVKQKSPAILRKLMVKGADPNVPYRGMTAKQFAEKEKLTEIVRILSGN